MNIPSKIPFILPRHSEGPAPLSPEWKIPKDRIRKVPVKNRSNLEGGRFQKFDKKAATPLIRFSGKLGIVATEETPNRSDKEYVPWKIVEKVEDFPENCNCNVPF